MAIVAIWLAVLFVGRYGSSLNYESQRIDQTITAEPPIVFLVATCAVVATIEEPAKSNPSLAAG